jgi:hypothetical protein
MRKEPVAASANWLSCSAEGAAHRLGNADASKPELLVSHTATGTSRTQNTTTQNLCLSKKNCACNNDDASKVGKA